MAKTYIMSKYTAQQIEELLDKGMKYFGISTDSENKEIEENKTETTES